MVKLISGITLMFGLLVAAANGYADTAIINNYDANGNLVSGDGRYYEYNDANQLARVRQGDKAGPVIAEYFYDPSGRRVKKVENGVVTYYVGKHFEKQASGSNAGSTSYYFGEGGERVAKKDPAGNIFYYHLDHLDGVNAVTDSAGTLVAKTDYLPFGEVRSGSSGSDKYSYTGKEKDKTDLYYFEARYNSPEFRHFTQADIAEPDYEDPQDLNRYAYVGNNPLSYVDEDGFKKKKKAKLSKREKWMIAHGVDPDHDKTPLKKAKKLFKAGKKYTTAGKSKIAKASSAKSNSAGRRTAGENVFPGAADTRYDTVEFPNTYLTANNISDEDQYKSQMINRGMEKFDKFLKRNILSLPEDIPYVGCAFTALNRDPVNVVRGEKKLDKFTGWVSRGILKTNPQFFIKLGESRIPAFELEEAIHNFKENIEDLGIPLGVLSCIDSFE